MTVLYDNHGRPVNYLRLAVTDRCNLRCFYCMPESGITYLPKKELLSFEEMERVVSLMASMGVTKLRITGGEPFVRNDLMTFVARIVDIPGLKEFHLTTNGVLTAPHIPELKRLGLSSVNLSLDTLDRGRFRNITKRDEFGRVWQTLQLLLEHEIPLKINAVVMDNKNIDDLIPMVHLTKNNKIAVRFIEEMPFNGEGNHYPALNWTYKKILSFLLDHFPDLEKCSDEPHATAAHYRIPGYAGTIGIIAGYSRTFCGSCNRIRVTAQGMLKTCLYDQGVLDIKGMMRSGADDEQIRRRLFQAFSSRAKDGFEAEARRQENHRVSESMSTIGG